MATKTKNTKAFYNTEIPSDWEVKKFEKIAKFFSGGTPLTSKSEYYSGNIPFIKSGEIYFDKTEQFISDEGLNNSSAKMVEKGDLLYALYGANSGEVAISKINGAINQAILCIRHNGDCETVFIYNYLQQQKENIIRTYLQGGQGNLSAEIVKTLPIPLPPLPEQKAIARVLSTADAAIHTTEKLIAQKELRKKWLMQQLLTGKKRLKGFENTKWKIQPLENFIKPIVREVPKPDVPYLGIGLRSHGKGTFLKYDEQPEKNSMDKFYVVRPNDLIVNITFAWEQAIAIVRPEDDGALASHRFPTYTFIEEKGHPDFFRFYILQPRMKFMLEMISPGGAGRNRVMSKKDFIKLEFLLPEYKEQTAIAQVLQAADKEISLLKAKAEKLREQKKGLMQKLLTGKVRLKID